MFPKKFLGNWYEQLDLRVDRGKHIVLKAEMENVDTDVFACGYADQKLFTFVCTAGTTVRTASVLRHYQKTSTDDDGVLTPKKYAYQTARVSVAKQYFEHSGIIDVFNQKCQG